MPRGKPTSIVEQRITLGSFERSWLVEQEEYLKTRLNIVTAGAVAIPVVTGVAALGGLGLVGYGAYAGMCALADAIPANPLDLVKKPIEVISILNPLDQSRKAQGARVVLITKFLTWAGIDKIDFS